MALNFVDELPKATRGGGSTVVTPDVVKALQDNPAKWAKVTTDPVRSAQSYANFCKSNEGYRYATRSAGKKSVTLTSGPNKGNKVDAPVVDVYMTFDPEGKAKA